MNNALAFIAAGIVSMVPFSTVNPPTHPDQTHEDDVLVVDGRLAEYDPYKGVESESGGILAWTEKEGDKTYQYQKRIPASD